MSCLSISDGVQETKKIKYYKRRKCDITFKVGEHEIIRTIEQYPHFLLPRGDHPYYQWGRKRSVCRIKQTLGKQKRDGLMIAPPLMVKVGTMILPDFIMNRRNLQIT